MKRLILVILIVTASISLVSGKTWGPVDLARELQRLNASEWDIPTFVCYAHNVSNLETHGTDDHSSRQKSIGIFGLPVDRLAECGNVSTHTFGDDDIADDFHCLTTLISYGEIGWTTRLRELSAQKWNRFECFRWWDKQQPYDFVTFGSDDSDGCPRRHRKEHAIECKDVLGSLTTIFIVAILIVNLLQLVFWAHLFISKKRPRRQDGVRNNNSM